MGETKFILLTDLAGEALILNLDHIVCITAEDGSEPVKHEHNAYDPDCHCELCLGKPCDCETWTYQSVIVIDLVDVEVNGEYVVPERQTWRVRETVCEIGTLLEGARLLR